MAGLEEDTIKLSRTIHCSLFQFFFSVINNQYLEGSTVAHVLIAILEAISKIGLDQPTITHSINCIPK